MLTCALPLALLFAPASAMQSRLAQAPANLIISHVAGEAAFEAFRAQHGQSLTLEKPEYEMRKLLFQNRVAEVAYHNSLASTWRKGVNRFADRTPEELQQYLGYKPQARKRGSQASTGRQLSVLTAVPSNLPMEKSWRGYFNTESIRDQGHCGSCWAVTAETVLAIHSELHGANQSFSVQEIVDCTPNPNKCGGTGGCQGSTAELAMQYAMLKGLSSPSTYGDYTASDYNDCYFQPSSSTTPSMEALTDLSSDTGVYMAQAGAAGLLFGMTGWERLPSNAYKPLLLALVKYGPVAISIAASDLHFYDNGIFDGCNSFVVNHAVTLVGYGEDESGSKYYLIQNSWGAWWGEEGRVRVKRTDEDDEHCGIDNQPMDGVACEGETDPVKVCGHCGVLYDSVVPRFGN